MASSYSGILAATFEKFCQTTAPTELLDLLGEGVDPQLLHVRKSRVQQLSQSPKMSAQERSFSGKVALITGKVIMFSILCPFLEKNCMTIIWF